MPCRNMPQPLKPLQCSEWWCLFLPLLTLVLIAKDSSSKRILVLLKVTACDVRKMTNVQHARRQGPKENLIRDVGGGCYGLAKELF